MDPFSEMTEEHRDLMRRLMDVLDDCEHAGLVAPFCGMHDGPPLTDAEVHDVEEHGLDRCIPSIRIFLPSSHESVVEPEDEPEEEPDEIGGPGEHMEENVIYLTTWSSRN